MVKNSSSENAVEVFIYNRNKQNLVVFKGGLKDLRSLHVIQVSQRLGEGSESIVPSDRSAPMVCLFFVSSSFYLEHFVCHCWNCGSFKKSVFMS